MAGQALGTVFVELNLETDPFNKSLNKIKSDAGVVVLDVEKNFQNLGIKSAQHFDLLRNRILNAYEGIKHSATSTTADIERAHRAATEKIIALNKEQERSTGSFATTIKSHWLAISAAVAGSMGAIYTARELMMEGAKAMQSEEAFRNVAASWNVNADQMIAAMKRVTNNTVDDSDLMQKAMKGMTGTLNPDQMLRIAEMSRLAARRMGVDVTEAYNNITDAAETMRTRALFAAGLVTKGQMEIVNAAKAAGAEIDIVKIMWGNYQAQLERTGPIEENAIERMQKHVAQWKELREDIGKAINALVEWGQKVAVVGAKWVTNPLEMYRQAAFGPGVTGVSPATPEDLFGPYPTGNSIRQQQAAEANAELERARAAALKPYHNEVNSSLTAWRKNIEALNPYLTEQERHVQNLTFEADALVNKLTELAEKNKTSFGGSKEIYAGLEEAKRYIAREQDIKRYQAESKQEAQRLARREQYANEYEKIVMEQTDFALNLNERQLNAITAKENETLGRLAQLYAEDAITFGEWQKSKSAVEANAARSRLEVEVQTAKRIADANEGLLVNIKGMSNQWHEYRMKQIEAEAKRLQALGADQRAITAMVADEIQKAEIIRAQKSEDVFAGGRAGILETYRGRMTGGQAGYQGTIDAIKNVGDVFSSVFGDVMKGQLKSFKDYWDSLWNSMADSFARILSKMVTDWIAAQMTMAATGGSSGSGGGGFLASIPFIGSLFGGGGGGGAGNLSMGGNWFTESGAMLGYAKGGVITSPTIFPMAHGMGLAGEAGYEGVLPLARTSSGDLGVKTADGGSGRNIILNNPVFQDVSTLRQTMAIIAETVARRVAPEAVIQNYRNDGNIRSMVRGKVT